MILAFEGIMINRLCNYNRLSENSHLFPGVFFVLCASLTIEYIPFQAFLLSNLFMIWALWEMFMQSRNEKTAERTYNVGLLIGISSLFFFPYICYILLAIVGLIFIRTFRSIDILRILLGFLTPYFLAFTVLFLMDQNLMWMNTHFRTYGNLFNMETSPKTFIIIPILLLMMALALAFIGRLGRSFNVFIKRKINVIYILLLMATIIVLISPSPILFSTQVIILPIGILLGLSIYQFANKTVAEIIHITLLLIALIFQYIVI